MTDLNRNKRLARLLLGHARVRQEYKGHIEDKIVGVLDHFYYVKTMDLMGRGETQDREHWRQEYENLMRVWLRNVSWEITGRWSRRKLIDGVIADLRAQDLANRKITQMSLVKKGIDAPMLPEGCLEEFLQDLSSRLDTLNVI